MKTVLEYIATNALIYLKKSRF